MRISIGCDHIVTDIKMKISDYLKSKGHDVIDNGTYDHVRTHYPIYGKKTAEKVVSGEADLAIVLCGTGVGITTSADKVFGARAALVRDVSTAIYVKKKLNANVIGIGGRILGLGLIENIIDAFLETKFEDNKENRNLIEKIDRIAEFKDGQLNNEHFFDEFIEKWNNGEYSVE
ncbi:galactose-6-phosphate isomerase subunit LacB [Clostridium perfringens]|uniref:galactose-6-phosphate isomerase subunit LacB n=1 Tax=Clostridium perfringens TaxID=1502 RepID=UPI00285DF3B5|nr:galactose-6-phosphate isomerase subunit LacB [Clostridium perfringens]MDK0553979.1 galactose-6-phosphate isomerase subunit LacB [Clostridium perfringens]